MNAAELRLKADEVRAKLKEEQKNMNRVKEVVVTANTTGAQEAKEQKKPEKIDPAPMVKHIERMESMESAEDMVSGERKETDTDVEDMLKSAGITVQKSACEGGYGEKHEKDAPSKEKAKNKAEANFDIKLPASISPELPLKVFDCDEKMRDYCNQTLGDADILVWSLNDAASHRLSIMIKYIEDGNQDAPHHIIKREQAMKSKTYLNFLMGYTGIDKTIVRYVGQVIEKSIPLLDKAEKGRKATMSPIDIYKDAVAEIRRRAAKIYAQNLNIEKEPLDVIYKVIEKENVDGTRVEFVCAKGKKALQSVLNEIGAECQSKDFLVNMKTLTNYAGSERTFLEVSQYRQFDYTETGGTHWTHLRVYDDILIDTDNNKDAGDSIDSNVPDEGGEVA